MESPGIAADINTSFRGASKTWTRNLSAQHIEIPDMVLRTIPEW